MATANNTLETLLNEDDVARVTGMSVASVRRWRLFRQGPKYLKIGAAVRYRPADILVWLSSQNGRPQPPGRDWLCACLRNLAVPAGVEALRTVIHYMLSRLG